MAFDANLDLVPLFLEADSREDLIRLMLVNNHINSRKFNYMGPPVLENKKYVVWFYGDIKDHTSPADISDDEMKTIRELTS